MNQPSTSSLKLLFVTRKFPPSVGGMENVARDLYAALRPLAAVRLIAYGGPNKYLPLVYPWLLARALAAGLRRRPDVVYIQDGVMAPLGLVLRAVLRRPVVVTVHGTEMVYDNPLYTRTVLPALRRLDAGVAISHATRRFLTQKAPGLPTSVISWGVHDTLYLARDRAALRQAANRIVGNGVDLTDTPVVYLAGRLIDRKGALWFVGQVMPRLRRTVPDVQCLIAGTGPDRPKLEEAIGRLKLEKWVYVVGTVLGEQRAVLYNCADVFVMPNIRGFGFEGFGMVALEASSCGTPVIAADIDGIGDAVKDGTTGYLLPPGDAAAFADRIASELRRPSLERADVRAYTLSHFTWDRTAQEHLRLFEGLAKKARSSSRTSQ